jgi:hypothetical protein
MTQMKPPPENPGRFRDRGIGDADSDLRECCSLRACSIRVVSVHIIDPLQKLCYFYEINGLGWHQAKPLMPLNLVFGQPFRDCAEARYVRDHPSVSPRSCNASFVGAVRL